MPVGLMVLSLPWASRQAVGRSGVAEAREHQVVLFENEVQINTVLFVSSTRYVRNRITYVYNLYTI